MKRLLIIPFILALSGCEDKNDPYYVPVTAPQVKVEQPAAQAGTGKWKVEVQAKFYAGYQNNEREILIITDPDGKQYLAITGCGVTEIVKKGKSRGEE